MMRMTKETLVKIEISYRDLEVIFEQIHAACETAEEIAETCGEDDNLITLRSFVTECRKIIKG